jgi:ABC-type Fe3+/spermidine/putrescine transport system ATPase subunit
MLDEPLGALDRTLRERLLTELGAILRAMKQTALYVTHDQEEAFALADRVVVMNLGRVAQTGAPQEIYRRPASAFVARFLGMGNILEGNLEDGTVRTEIGDWEMGALGEWQAGGKASMLSKGNSASFSVLIRPDGMRLDGSGSCALEGIVRGRTFRGNLCQVEVEIAGRALTFEFPSAAPVPGPGEPLRLSFNPREAIQILT